MINEGEGHQIIAFDCEYIWGIGFCICFYCDIPLIICLSICSQLKHLVELNAKEVLLEFLLCVLHQGQITEAKYIFTVCVFPSIACPVTVFCVFDIEVFLFRGWD
jgi:hypothetical protein